MEIAIAVATLCLAFVALFWAGRRFEEKASELRSELGQTLSNNRIEFQKGLERTTEMLDKRMGQLTEGVQGKLDLNLKEGFRHFEKVQEHLKNATGELQSLNRVGQSINDLNSILKLPHLRGGFGEATLERLLTDLLPLNGFELQYMIVPGSAERVDAVVKFPKSVLPIDSKFPREQVLPLFESNDPKALEAARLKLAETIKTQAKSIKDKYLKPEHGTTDMALIFIPSESLYFEILRNIKLTEHLAKLKVFAVSPNTLAVTLHSISIAREYYEMAKGVEKTIQEIKKTQKHFENFGRRFEEIGTSLDKSQQAFQTARTHLDRYEGAMERLGNKAPDTLAEKPPPELNA